MAEGFWGLVTIVGPIILVAAIAWAMLHNRQSKRQFQETEAATRRVREEEAERDRTATP